MAIKLKGPIEKEVDRLFDNMNAKAGECCVNPVTGNSFASGVDPIGPQKKDAVRALRARERFAADGPPDALPLPLSCNDVDDYRNAGGLAGIVGFYARSLSRLDYDLTKHPGFKDFARGLMAMAVERGLWDLEKDAQLIMRFPPRPLAGMTPGAYWAGPKEYEATMASYRRDALLRGDVGQTRH
jgi:hypothetical protein